MEKNTLHATEEDKAQEEMEEFREYLLKGQELIDVTMEEFVALCLERVTEHKKYQDTKMLLISCKAYFVQYRDAVKKYLSLSMTQITLEEGASMQEEAVQRQAQFDNMINAEIVITRIEERMALLELIKDGKGQL